MSTTLDTTTLTLKGVVKNVESVRFVHGRQYNFYQVTIVLSEEELARGRSFLKEHGWRWHSGQPITISGTEINVNVTSESQLPQTSQPVNVNFHYSGGPKPREETTMFQDQTMDDDAISVTLAM